MAASEQNRRLGLFALLGAVALTPTCAPLITLEGRGCPCADGYECCESSDTCVPHGTSCPAPLGSGGSDTGGEANHGGVTGQAKGGSGGTEITAGKGGETSSAGG